MSEQGEARKETDNTSDKQPNVDKVTAVEKSEKAKDPRKVELGKRLAKISREAKERKARQQLERAGSENANEETTRYIDFGYLVGGVGLVTAIGSLYFAYKKDKRESEQIEQMAKIPSTRGLSSEATKRRKRHRPEVSAAKLQPSLQVYK